MNNPKSIIISQGDSTNLLFRALYDRLRYQHAIIIVRILAIKPWVISWFVRDSFIKQSEYQDQPILLMALWEKGQLRSDVALVLKTAKEKGAFVVGVNTRRLKRDSSDLGFFDCYIERYNHGRDFGSYKSGYRYLLRKGILDRAPRLILFNDSIYYARNNLENFLTEMLETGTDVLGATENFEHSRHLGSFAISIGAPVLRHKRFRRFWRRYRNTDLRPLAIKRGELALSKVLQRCASSDFDFRALYNLSTMASYINSSDERLATAIEGLFKNRFDSIKVTPKDLLDMYIEGNSFHTYNDQDGQTHVTTELNNLSIFANTYRAAIEGTQILYPNLEPLSFQNQFRIMATGEYLLAAVSGSQIHRNASTLLHMGCPIIKLDAIFRGTLTYEGAEYLLKLVDGSDRDALRELWFGRSYGGASLFGYQRYAFIHGWI
jgi:hypothetical protein